MGEVIRANFGTPPSEEIQAVVDCLEEKIIPYLGTQTDCSAQADIDTLRLMISSNFRRTQPEVDEPA